MNTPGTVRIFVYLVVGVVFAGGGGGMFVCLP